MRINKAFTLIELLIVIAIIGILASIVLVSLNDSKKKSAEASYVSHVASYRNLILAAVSDGAFEGVTQVGHPTPLNRNTFYCLGDYAHPEAETVPSGGGCWGSVSINNNLNTILQPYAELAPGQISPTRSNNGRHGGTILSIRGSSQNQRVEIRAYVGPGNASRLCPLFGFAQHDGSLESLGNYGCRGVYYLNR